TSSVNLSPRSFFPTHRLRPIYSGSDFSRHRASLSSPGWNSFTPGIVYQDSLADKSFCIRSRGGKRYITHCAFSIGRWSAVSHLPSFLVIAAIETGMFLGYTPATYHGRQRYRRRYQL